MKFAQIFKKQVTSTFRQTKDILLAENNTSNVIKYNIKNGKHKKINICTQPFNGNFRALQIDQGTLVVTGGHTKIYENRITIIKSGKVQELEMVVKRTSHSIAYYKEKKQIFIIAGFNGQRLEECEVFELNTQQIQQISKFPESSCLGSAAIVGDKLYNFGGYNAKGYVKSI